MSTALYDPPRVGGDILSGCSKCKMDLAHVIVSMVGNRPAKVQCKTCKGEHKYKPVAGSSAAATLKASRKPAAPKPSVRAAEAWQTKMNENSGKVSRPYKANESFKAGELIEHIKFGVGFIEEVRPGKISVLFKDDSRILIHEVGK